MSEKDVTATKYFDDPKRVADLLNVSIFKGKRLFLPENIVPHHSRNFLPTKKRKKVKSITINKDIVHEAKLLLKATIFAFELQSDIHLVMPVRVMGGDSANYHNQWEQIKKKHQEANDVKGIEYLSGFSKTDKLIPATTIVIYFGKEKWTGPRCLKDVLDLDGLPQELQDYIADYPLHIIEVRKFLDYELFETDLKLVFGFLQRDSNFKELHEFVNNNKEGFEDLTDDAYDLISNFSHSKELVHTKEEYRTQTGGVNMCEALIQLKQEGFEEGIRATIKICRNLGISIEAVIQQIISECSLSESQAKEYVDKYWN